MIPFIIILNFIFSLFYLINIKLIILKNIKNYNHIKEILEELCTICSKFFLYFDSKFESFILLISSS